MRELLDKNKRATVPFDPALYRHINYERIQAILQSRGYLHWPNPDPGRKKQRTDLLAQGAEMPLIGTMQLICEYESGELNRAECLGLFSALIESELITFLPYPFQFIAFNLVVHGDMDPDGRWPDEGLDKGLNAAQG